MKNVVSNLQTESNIDLFEKSDLSNASRNLVLHHLGSFKGQDLARLMSDYTEESVLITQKETYTGIQQIRSFFVDFLKYFPSENSTFTLDQIVVKDELVFIVWHGETPTLLVPFGSDTFVINEGKIRHQTFVGELNFMKA